MKKRIPALLFLSLLVFLSSCSVTEEVALSPTEENTSATLLEVQPFFIDVLNDFEEFADENNPSHAMDKAVDTMAQTLRESGGADEVVFFKIVDKLYQGTFTFGDISTLLSDLGAGEDQSVLVKSGNTLTFHLDIDNYEDLAAVVPFLREEDFEPFSAPYNRGMSEEDYYEMVSFMLGDNAPDAIRDSSVTLYIKTPGPIVKSRNGRLLDKRTFRFTFPLIDFLLLSKPIECSVTWS